MTFSHSSGIPTHLDAEAATTTHDSAISPTSANPTLTVPLLNGEPAETGIDINAPATFEEALRKHAPLPTKFSCGDTPAATFAVGTALAASTIYYVCTEDAAIKDRVGGIGANFPANVLFGVGTYEFWFSSAKGVKSCMDHVITAVATVGGLITTVPSTIATFTFAQKHGKPEWFQFAGSALNFAGSVTGNIYALYATIQHCLEWKNDDPEKREFLLDEFAKSLPPEYKNILESKRGVFHRWGKRILGAAAGASLGASLAGYMCNSIKFFGTSVGGYILGIATNSPTLLLAIMAGFDLGEESANLAADLYNYMFGEKKIVLTATDKKFLAAFILVAIGCSYISANSSATSESVYGDCPHVLGQMPAPVASVLENNLIAGTDAFNGIWMAKSIYAIMKRIKIAYFDNDDDREVDHIREMENFLKKAPIQKLETMAMEHDPNYSGKFAEWKKAKAETAAAQQAAKTSFCSSVTGFFCKKKQPTPVNNTENTANNHATATEQSTESRRGGFWHGEAQSPAVKTEQPTPQLNAALTAAGMTYS